MYNLFLSTAFEAATRRYNASDLDRERGLERFEVDRTRIERGVESEKVMSSQRVKKRKLATTLCRSRSVLVTCRW